MTKELKNTDMLLTDAELDAIAGGKIDWYYRPDVNVRSDGTSVEGYLIEGENHETGATVATRFIEKDQLTAFKKKFPGDNFFKGSLKVVDD